jgi:hypothetical protein
MGDGISSRLLNTRNTVKQRLYRAALTKSRCVAQRRHHHGAAHIVIILHDECDHVSGATRGDAPKTAYVLIERTISGEYDFVSNVDTCTDPLYLIACVQFALTGETCAMWS